MRAPHGACRPSRRRVPRLAGPCLLLAIILVIGPGGFVCAQSGSVGGIPLAEYRQRRERILSSMDSNSIAVFPSAMQKNRNGDTDYPYRQESSFLYLTGFTGERAVLLLSAKPLMVNGSPTRELLFVREKNPLFEMWNGETAGVEGTRERYGVPALSIRSARKFLDSILATTATLYYSSPGGYIVDPVTGIEYASDREVRKELARRFPSLKLRSIANTLARLRGIKSPAELVLLQKAIDATVAAQVEAMKSCIPGMFEYELQAVIEYCFIRFGAESPGFPSIVGSGHNSTILHYMDNRRRMRSGEVVVMDIGAEYSGYSADVTRTIPVNGKFSPEQREIYEVVLRAQEEAIREIRPGAKTSAIQGAASRVIGGTPFAAFLPHGVSHGIGLDVHDVGVGSELKPGMVVTVEPGIYIPAGAAIDSKYWDIGIRIEDDVLVTEDGCRVLSARAPRSIDEIEELMQKEGLGNRPAGEK